MPSRQRTQGDVAIDAIHALFHVWNDTLVPALRGTPRTPKGRARSEVLYRLWSLIHSVASLDINAGIVGVPVLCRSVLEHVVDLLFIDQEPVEVAKRYLSYRKIGYYRYLSLTSPSFDKERGRREVVAPILAEHYSGRELKNVRKWSLVSTEQKCRKIDQKKWYDTYRMMCWATHNDPTCSVEMSAELLGQCRDIILVETLQALIHASNVFCAHCRVAGTLAKPVIEQIHADFALKLAETPPRIPPAQ